MTRDTILSYFGKELAIALSAAEKTDYENTRSVDGEKGADTVEFRGENTKDN